MTKMCSGANSSPCFSRSTGSGELTQFVAVMVVIGKSAEFKIVPHAVVGKFHLGSFDEIAGEEGEDASLRSP